MSQLSTQNGEAAALNAVETSEGLDIVVRHFLLMDRTVDLLIEKTNSSELWPELYERALQTLNSLPLSSDEYTLASRRVQNAFAYASNREHGAAAFELRLLRGQLAA